MFFAVTGAMGHIPTVLKMAPTLFLHTFIQIVVHFTFSISVGKLFKLPLREIVLASNANVGGMFVSIYVILSITCLLCDWFNLIFVSDQICPKTCLGPTTAAAMASSKKWKQLVLPALLTGMMHTELSLPLIPLLLSMQMYVAFWFMQMYVAFWFDCIHLIMARHYFCPRKHPRYIRLCHCDRMWSSSCETVATSTLLMRKTIATFMNGYCELWKIRVPRKMRRKLLSGDVAVIDCHITEKISSLDGPTDPNLQQKWRDTS